MIVPNRFDPDRLSLPTDAFQDLPRVLTRGIPRQRQTEPFLKGPIPWKWIQVAARLPGKALAVGLVIWHLVGLCRSETVHLQPSKIRSLGLSRRQARRGLRNLKQAGLITIHSRPGCAHDVTVLDASEREIPS